MAKPLIVLDGYNLALEKGTGVATYARNLSYRLHAMGADVGVLYGHRSSGAADEALREISFFDPRPPAQSRLMRGITDTVRVVNGLMGVEAISVPVAGRVVRRPLDARLPYFDGLWTAPDLFRAATIGFGLTGRFARVRLSRSPALMHWTYPVPVSMPGTLNIYAIHDLVPLRMPFATSDNKRRHLRLLRSIALRADHIVTVSEASRRDIVSLLGVPEERVTNTYQAVAIPKALTEKPQSMVRDELEGGFGLTWQGYWLFFGAIEPKKNVGRLIEAYLASGSRLPLVICGRQAWQAQQELDLLYEDDRRIAGVQGELRRMRERIILLDYVPFRLLVSLIRGARAVLFPSLYEGFGLPALEAMLLGTPVMTSNTSSLPEVVGDAALTVDPYDIRAMAEAVKALDSDADLRGALAARGPGRAALFDTAAYEKRLDGLYRRLGLVLPVGGAPEARNCEQGRV